jgi:hypothetical protein
MMQLSDNIIKTIVIVLILVYTGTLIIQLMSHSSFNFIAWLNVISASAILIFWTSKQLRISQHYYDSREIIFLCIECFFAGITIYSIIVNATNPFFNIMKYVIYGIHLAAMLALLLFMVTFKMNRLF